MSDPEIKNDIMDILTTLSVEDAKEREVILEKLEQLSPFLSGISHYKRSFVTGLAFIAEIQGLTNAIGDNSTPKTQEKLTRLQLEVARYLKFLSWLQYNEELKKQRDSGGSDA